jgi:hypothetical protein
MYGKIAAKYPEAESAIRRKYGADSRLQISPVESYIISQLVEKRRSLAGIEASLGME